MRGFFASRPVIDAGSERYTSLDFTPAWMPTATAADQAAQFLFPLGTTNIGSGGQLNEREAARALA